jgi:hypothetical protein
MDIKKAADIEKTENRRLRRSLLNMEKCYQGKTTMPLVMALERACSKADANQLQTIASKLFADIRCSASELAEM